MDPAHVEAYNWAKQWLDPANAIQKKLLQELVKQELKGKIVDEETGLDLSTIPVCPRCGLEMANRYEHEQWHQQQNQKIEWLERKIVELERSFSVLVDSCYNAIRGIKPWDDRLNPQKPHWISEEEIEKYAKKWTQK